MANSSIPNTNWPNQFWPNDPSTLGSVDVSHSGDLFVQTPTEISHGGDLYVFVALLLGPTLEHEGFRLKLKDNGDGTVSLTTHTVP